MKKLCGSTSALILYALIILLCFFSAETKAGALDGLIMCRDIIIPSLLAVIIICNLIINSRASLITEAIFGRFFEKVLKLPKCAAGAVALGLIGGYPTGAVLTYRLYSKGLIGSEQAKRIMRFNLCGGCAFIITAVGSITYGNTKTGLLLFAVCSVSDIIIMLLFGKCKSFICESTSKNYPGITDALPVSVEEAVKSLAVLSAYIILFSALCAMLRLPPSVYPILEITKGVCFAEIPLPLPYCAFFLSFGGLCVHLQVFGFLKKMKTGYADFLIHRMLAAVISFVLMKAFIYVFPQSAEVFSNISKPVHSLSSGGIPLSIIMITGCAVVVLDIENRKLKLI